MRVLSITPMSKNRVKICLDDGADFVLYKKEYESYGIEESGELSQADYDEIISGIIIPRCKKRALHLLEKQDRSELNLRGKLKEGGYSDDVVDAAIEYINGYGYLDDYRMACSHIRFYQDSRSRHRLMQDLKAKGISVETIERALEEEYSFDESALIEQLLLKKHYDRENATYEDRAKMYRFLASRGFQSDSINKSI